MGKFFPSLQQHHNTNKMSKVKDHIQHPGRIEKIEDGRITVTILSQSACSTCHSKSMCTVSEMEEKVIDIRNPENDEYKIGEQVTVYMKKSLGTKAVFYGYLFPFLVVLISLILLIALTNNEGLSALIALGLLVPYYYLMHLMKDRFSKTFEFSLEP
jgi:sigma-E factor negative regulatory protein RseC